MKTFLSISFWCVLICNLSFGQNTQIDSLKLIWKNTSQIDSMRFEAGLDLFMLQFRKDLDTARATGHQLLQFSIKKKKKTWEATSNRFIGNSFAVQGKYEDALQHFLISHEILLELNDKKGLATTFSNIGAVYYELGNYPTALTYLLKGLKISEELNDKPNLARVTNNLGNVYVDQKNNKKALEYYQYSLQLKEELGNRRSLPHTYNNIGLVYTNLKNSDLALENLLKSAKIAEEVDDQKSVTRAYNNIGAEYHAQGDFATALNYLNRTIELKKEINDDEGLPTAYAYRAQTYLSLKKYRVAIQDAEKALELSLKTGALQVQRQSYEYLSVAWEKLKSPGKSLLYYKKAITLRDSLFNQEKTNEITRQEMQYQFEKKQLSDSIAFTKQKADQELLFEKNLSRQRNTLYLVLFGSFALLLFGGFYWNNRQKSKKLAQERTVINRLKQVDQLKDQFLANTSHELRTPLNGIIGLSESLKDGIAGNLNPKAIENLDLIVNSGKRLSHLVNDILDFSKLKNKDISLAITQVDLHAIAEVIIKLSEPLILDKKIRLINSIPRTVPLIDADENRLQQILYNLIGNAIKFTPKGYISLFAEEQKGMLALSISDTGIGIPQDKLDTIFNSFEQGDGSTERKYGGTGLGLSVTKQLVVLHGGDISVSSEKGKGSIFTITLPISSEKQNHISSVVEKKQNNGILKPIQKTIELKDNLDSITDDKERKKYNILIVDDEPINRRVLQNHLSVAGYGVTEVSNGKEALETFHEDSIFDLILLDIMMPGMSGYEVCEKIRKNHQASELPIIMLTAKNGVSELVQGFNSGANDYLTKPFSKNELLSRIKTHLNLNSIHRAASKFVPTKFIKSVGRESITDVVLGDFIEKNVTVLFTDVRGYTGLSESMTPEQNFKFVNAYVGRMGPIIQQNQGFVNQYLGDGIMALFPHEAEHALDSAIEMQRTLTLYNKRRVEKGYLPIAVGMGLHTGPLVMGIIGDVNRNDTAIIADTVNTASRTEGVTKHYGANIVISEDSLQTIENKDGFNFRFLGKVKVKGKEKNIGIYECFDGDSPEMISLKTKTLKTFEKGLEYFFAKEFPKASAAFDKVLDENPKDAVAKYFITKSAEYTFSGAPKNWEMVNTMSEK